MNENKKNNSLFTHIRDFGIGPLFGMVIGMLTVPITTRLVSPEEFGKSSLFTLIQTIFNLLVLLGFDQSYVRFYNQKDIDKKSLLYNCMFFPCCLCALLIFILIVFRNSISIFMFGQYEPLLILGMAFFLPALIFNRFAILTIRMDLRGKMYSFINIFQQVLTFVSLLIFLFFYEKSFRSIVLSTIVSTVITSLLSIILSKNFGKLISIKLNKQLLWDLAKFGLPLIPAGVLMWIMNSFDKIGLRTWSTFEELGLYSAAFKIVSLLTVFQNIFSTSWTPIAYKWYEEKVPNKRFEDVGIIVLSLMTLLFSMIFIFRNVIIFFLGSEYRNTASVFIFLLFNPALYTVLEVTGKGIAFMKKSIYSLVASFVAATINFIGNYYMIPLYGAIGAALSTCTSYLIFFFVKTFLARKIWFKFPMKNYFIDIILLLGFGINMLTIQNRIIEYSIFAFICLFNGYYLYSIFIRRRKKTVDVTQNI